jgi:hypothetical protein
LHLRLGLVVLDPSVGCWLLQPDSCFDSFGDCVQLLVGGAGQSGSHHGSAAGLIKAKDYVVFSHFKLVDKNNFLSEIKK